MKKLQLILCLALLCCCNCHGAKQPKDASTGDSTIIAKQVIDPNFSKEFKLLITNHFSTYYIDKGQERGLGYELLSLYLKKKGWSLKLIMLNDIEHVRDSLISTGAHMAAATFITPKNRIKNTLYTDFLYKTDLRLIQRQTPNHRIVTPSDSEPIDVKVIRDAPYEIALFRDRKPFPGLNISYAGPNSTKQSLIEDVANGNIDYAISGELESEIMKVFYPNINNDVVLLENAEVSYMVNPQCTELLKDFNNWLTATRKTSDFQWTVIKYNNFPRDLRKSMQYIEPKERKGMISNYDPLVKKYAENIHWDWKMLAALIYQESKFNHAIVSSAGAMGLMQVLPTTARSLTKIQRRELFNPDKNIYCGTKLINWLDNNMFKNSNITEENRMKFILAAYNCGIGHLSDARALAVKYNLDPNIWDNNVEIMLLNKSNPRYYRDPVCKYGYCRGQEPVLYVKNIMKYHQHYQSYRTKGEITQ